MKKINSHTLPEEVWTSSDGQYSTSDKDISVALGREANSTDLMKRHPFDVEITRVAPGKPNTPFHAHSEQWEFYHILSGTGKVRDAEGETPIEPGDAFLFKPGEAHQIFNNGTEDLVMYVIADNPLSESVYYPDDDKWIVRSPRQVYVREMKRE